MHERESALKKWLIQLMGHNEFILTPLQGDASFRRYFRLSYNDLTYIVMDAPPDRENSAAFIRAAKTLAQAGVHAPLLVATDEQQGFLLLSDFGDQLLLSQLNNDTVNDYYKTAIKTLLNIQNCAVTDSHLLTFDKAHMLMEMNLCNEWFFQSYLSLIFNAEEKNLINNTMNWIAEEILLQPQVYIHRDYHSRNLMCLTDNQLGVIDFQDAMRGPITYDLASLLKDCYISWPREKVLEWVIYFYNQSVTAQKYTVTEWTRAFDLCGLQRHLKVLGIFCRLYLRDEKSGYLKDLPLTLNYVLECCEIYDELHPFFNLLQQRVYLP
jgi:N-acetylmuramate 1-kinase